MAEKEKDDLPSEPVKSTKSISTKKQKPDAPAKNEPSPAPAAVPNQQATPEPPQAPSSPSAPAPPSQPQIPQQSGFNYDSNPFSITFNNFTKLFKHAQAVAIIMVVFSGLNVLFNAIPPIDNSEFDSINTTETQTFNNELLRGVELDQSDPFSLNNEVNDISSTSNSSSEDIDVGVLIAIIAVVFVLIIVFSTIGLAITAIWMGIVGASANNAVRDRDLRFSEAWSLSIKRFSTMFVALFISALKIIGGYFLLIVPGVRAQARYAALPFVVMGNPSMNAKEAVEESKRLYEGHLMESIAISFVGGIIPVVGTVLSSVGLAQSARQISDYKSRGLPKPKMSGWNWAPFIFLAAIGALVALILLIVFIVAVSTVV